MLEMNHAKQEMDLRIRHYFLFEKFLNVVIHQTEFKTITEMINRYLLLVQAKNDLANLQESNLKALETARSNMVIRYYFYIIFS